MISILMFLEHPETKKKFKVDYDHRRYDHDIWDEDGYLGRIEMRELFFAGYKCVNKIISVEE